MKKVMMALLGLLSLTLTACDNEDDNKEGIKNFWTLTVENKTLYGNDAEGVKVTITLAYAAAENYDMVPVLSGTNADAFYIDPTIVTIKKGKTKGEFYVRPNANSMFTDTSVLTLTLEEVEGLNSGNPVNITAEPFTDVQLTAAQKALARKWQTTFGFDVHPFVGVLRANATVTFNTDDKEAYNDGNETAAYTSQCVVTISDNADDDNIVLSMKGNALGLRDFFYKMLQAQTVDDADYWVANPNNAHLLEVVGYDKVTETFTVNLDVTIDPETKTISFTNTKPNIYEEEITVVPFIFNFSAWERQLSLADFVMDNGESASEQVTMEEAIGMGVTLSPDYYLISSDISYDAWESDPSLYTTPAASYDNKEMTFTFPWDFMNAYGYERIQVKLTLNK